MTPPETWTPLPETVDYIARWYAWAMNGAPEGEPYSRNIGLCRKGMSAAVVADLETAFAHEPFPFGAMSYMTNMALETQHECPNRLAFCRAVLVRAGREIDDG